MRFTSLPLGLAALVCSTLCAFPSNAQDSRPEGRADLDGIVTITHGPGGESSRFRDFGETTRGAEKIDGLFTLYKKEPHLYASIRPDQFNQPLLAPTMIARGMAQAGMPVGDDDMVIVFNRVGDKVQLVRRNIHYTAPSGTPLDKSVKQNYVDSILMSLPIVSIDNAHGGGSVIDLAEIFLTDFAQLGLGSIDRSRSSISRVKGFPNNIELEAELTFSGGSRYPFLMAMGGDGVADHRGITVVVHYSLMKTPDSGYKTRQADDRVGHFLERQQGLRQNRLDQQLRPIDQPLEAGESRWKAAAFAAEEADCLVCRGYGADRIQALRRIGNSRVEQGFREDWVCRCHRCSLARIGQRRIRP